MRRSWSVACSLVRAPFGAGRGDPAGGSTKKIEGRRQPLWQRVPCAMSTTAMIRAFASVDARPSPSITRRVFDKNAARSERSADGGARGVLVSGEW